MGGRGFRVRGFGFGRDGGGGRFRREEPEVRGRDAREALLAAAHPSPLDFSGGSVRLAFSLRLGGSRPLVLYIDPRQYTEAKRQKRENLSGPMIWIHEDGAVKRAETKRR